VNKHIDSVHISKEQLEEFLGVPLEARAIEIAWDNLSGDFVVDTWLWDENPDQQKEGE